MLLYVVYLVFLYLMYFHAFYLFVVALRLFVDYSILSQRVDSSRDDPCQIEPIFFDIETTGLG